MKKVIAFVLIMTLIFTLGCAAKTAPKPLSPAQKVPVDTAPVAEAAAPVNTAAAVTDIETELNTIDDLDEEFLTTDLDNLDSELDFEI